jgi:hypothetical protein
MGWNFWAIQSKVKRTQNASRRRDLHANNCGLVSKLRCLRLMITRVCSLWSANFRQVNQFSMYICRMRHNLVIYLYLVKFNFVITIYRSLVYFIGDF